MTSRVSRTATALLGVVMLALSGIAASPAAFMAGHAAAREDGHLQQRTAETLLAEARAKRGIKSDQPIKSLLIRSNRALGNGLPEQETVRLLWPDHFQRIGSRTHTIQGDKYWQQPTPSAAAVTFAERNTRHRFAETALIFLLRPSSGMQMKEVDRAPDRGLEFTDPSGFRRVLVFSADLTLKAVEEQGELTQGATKAVVGRVLSLEKYAAFDGISFPVGIIERIGNSSATIGITDVQVNRGITRADFAEVQKESR